MNRNKNFTYVQRTPRKAADQVALSRVILSAEMVIADKGILLAEMGDIATLSGVLEARIRSRFFKNILELVHALQARYLEALDQRWAHFLCQVNDVDAHQLIDKLARFFLRFGKDYVAYFEMYGMKPNVIGQDLRHRIKDLLIKKYGEIIREKATTISGVLAEIISAFCRDVNDVFAEEWIKLELREAMYLYLRARLSDIVPSLIVATDVASPDQLPNLVAGMVEN